MFTQTHFVNLVHQEYYISFTTNIIFLGRENKVETIFHALENVNVKLNAKISMVMLKKLKTIL